MMNYYKKLRMIYKIMLPVTVMLVAALGILSWQIQSRSSTALRSVAERELMSLAGQYGNMVMSIFTTPLDEAKAMANSLGFSLEQGTPVPRELQITMMRGLLERNPSLMTTGIAMEAGVLGDDAAYAGKTGHDSSGRFMAYAERGGNIALYQNLDNSPYYTRPKANGLPVITRPYLYDMGGRMTMLTTVSAPIMLRGKFAGAFTIDLSVDRVGEIVNGIQIYQNGWASLLAEDGTVISHKNTELIGSILLQNKQVADKEGLRQAMQQGQSFMEIHALEGQESFYYYFPLHFEATGQTWYFAVSAPMSEVLAEARELSILTISMSAITLLLSMALIFFVIKISVQPLAYLASKAREIAEGNLRVEIQDAAFGGEIKELSSALKDMIASLLENIAKAEEMSADAQVQTKKAQAAMLEAEEARKAAERAKQEGMYAAADKLSDVVSVVSAASEQLSAQIEQSERGARDQAARVAETATAMEEMNSTVLEVAGNAGRASDLSGRTREMAEQGAKIVRGAVDGITDVQKVSLELKGDMSTLAEQAQSISRVMAVITDIADQTNLLALNAAIEAARAGEAGRGFAVVADEVRKLAEKTMASTSEVGEAINAIQGSVNTSIAQMDRAVDLIDKATGLSTQSGESLEEIVGMVDNNADQVRAIAAASEEQSAASEEINRSLSEINVLADQSAQTMREAAGAVNQLADQAQVLNRLIQEMKQG